ncbi:hypothetical protein [Shewanella gelidii]|uniref:SRCR domain-containing protein n=1 Tax=Shewanella gelidii TaxID=1642821 RepID=A0A917JND4_9GAMM|nr:hypothetical protein [Shewanella gelidii]MCL1097384.1 hypothetical protein [Shewanella gelidii]GGI74783.1 hypothetical protein GCM10009332_10250 [Shewanella gelidii]
MLVRKLLLVVIASTLSLTAYAGKDKVIQVNGKPFQQLNEEIQNNSAAISELDGRVDTIEGRVETLESEVATLKSDMATTRMDLAAQVLQIQSILNTTEELSDDLATLIIRHETDYNNLLDRFTQIQNQIASIEIAIAETQANLQAELDALAGDLSALDASTSARIASLASSLDDLNAALETAESSIVALQTGFNTLDAEIAGMGLRQDALEGRVSTLESYHGAQQCDRGNDIGTGSRYVVCEADSNQAWVSADNAGRYHAELICQELGYTTVSSWSGTCGNVCGYCQGPTSCESPGTPPEAHGRSWAQNNAGSDALGKMIASTVQWRCAN